MSTSKTDDAPKKVKVKMSFDKFMKLSAILSICSIYGATSAAVQPDGAGWRFFSYHPLLMTLGFVLCMGNGALVKKMGGYTNTKIHVSHKCCHSFCMQCIISPVQFSPDRVISLFWASCWLGEATM